MPLPTGAALPGGGSVTPRAGARVAVCRTAPIAHRVATAAMAARFIWACTPPSAARCPDRHGFLGGGCCTRATGAASLSHCDHRQPPTRADRPTAPPQPISPRDASRPPGDQPAATDPTTHVSRPPRWPTSPVPPQPTSSPHHVSTENIGCCYRPIWSEQHPVTRLGTLRPHGRPTFGPRPLSQRATSAAIRHCRSWLTRSGTPIRIVSIPSCAAFQRSRLLSRHCSSSGCAAAPSISTQARYSAYRLSRYRLPVACRTRACRSAAGRPCGRSTPRTYRSSRTDERATARRSPEPVRSLASSGSATAPPAPRESARPWSADVRSLGRSRRTPRRSLARSRPGRAPFLQPACAAASAQDAGYAPAIATGG